MGAAAGRQGGKPGPWSALLKSFCRYSLRISSGCASAAKKQQGGWELPGPAAARGGDRDDFVFLFLFVPLKAARPKMSGGKNLPHLQVDLNHSHPGPDHVLEG